MLNFQLSHQGIGNHLARVSGMGGKVRETLKSPWGSGRGHSTMRSPAGIFTPFWPEIALLLHGECGPKKPSPLWECSCPWDSADVLVSFTLSTVILLSVHSILGAFSGWMWAGGPWGSGMREPGWGRTAWSCGLTFPPWHWGKPILSSEPSRASSPLSFKCKCQV